MPKLSPVPIIKKGDIVIDVASQAAASAACCGKYRGTDVTIKIIRKNANGATKTCFWKQEEVVMLSLLRHPRVLTVFGIALFLETGLDAECWLVSEYMSRGSLYEVLHFAHMPLAHRLSTMRAKL